MTSSPVPIPTDPEQRLDITCAHCGKEIDFRRGEVYTNGPSYVCKDHRGRRLDIKGILSDPPSRQSLTDMATAGVISRLTRIVHTIPAQMDYDTRHKTFENIEKFGGGFCQKLAQAWYAADTSNKQRIEDAFPHLLEHFGPESVYWGK